MLAASPVASSVGSLVDASGYKYAEKDLKPGKVKLKRPSSKSAKSGKKLELHGKSRGETSTVPP
jgi:SAGA-associated factor 73